ncbi:hypothetical protein AQ490_10975 [Wenjunlia vitaminophila]|uniref:DUF4333 domain-containing protein n=2 Tax=Wenjunlia vitaminophila TaxID=76728 RepID=A0A0T6LKC9_WENVI|nr:hypothetical protein AQ490_10975 [Wenjunlia vitaminophila]
MRLQDLVGTLKDMGAHRWMAVSLTGLLVAFGPALVACDEAEEELTEAAVELAVDKLGSDRLRDAGVELDGMDCDTSHQDAEDRVSVVCTGETDDNRKIRITGTVSDEGGDCVRGALKAVVGTRTVFDLNALGDCATH